MLKIDLDVKDSLLKIDSYNGNFMKEEFYKSKSHLGKLPLSQKWNFFRQEDNHAYVGGNILYREDCRNNMIISPYVNNQFTNIKNAFILAGDSYVEIMPIFNLQEVINKGRKILSDKKIDYHIPETVFRRENLPEISLDRISEEVKNKYGLESKIVEKINSKISKNGIYFIVDKNDSKYILKYRGKNKEQAEILSKILASVPDYFPIVYPRKDCQELYNLEIDESHYGLEDFFEGDMQKERNLDYFSLVGNHIALLHNQLSNLSRKNKDLEKMLMGGKYISESNLASIYLDLARDSKNHAFLISSLEEIIKDKIMDKMKSLPSSLIHRDLNHSNIIWKGDSPKIIDSESIGVYERVNEFIAPLLLGENMSRPAYKKDTLPKLIDSYNQDSMIPLSKEEEKILPNLLKYALLKYYVVRTIRREIKDKYYLETIKKDIQNLGVER